MRIVRRTLRPDELYRAIAAGGPLREIGATPETLARASIPVVEVDGQVAAYWNLWYALHGEPLWIHPDWRHHPAVVGGIVEIFKTTFEATGEQTVFCTIETPNLDPVADYAQRLGFAEAPGRLFYLLKGATP